MNLRSFKWEKQGNHIGKRLKPKNLSETKERITQV